ncbi:hypothetical protein ACEPPN_000251 [Leptodophora sp. 'Broadleaf-Isolate-01']
MGVQKKLVNAAIVVFAFTIVAFLRTSSSDQPSKVLNVLVGRDSVFTSPMSPSSFAGTTIRAVKETRVPMVLAVA